MTWYRCEQGVVVLRITTQPGAKKTEIVGLYQDTLKIRVQAAAIEGRANQALLKFLALCFKVPLRNVRLVRGEQSRVKTITVTGSAIAPEALLVHR